MSKWILAIGCLALPTIGFGQAHPPKSTDWWDRELWSRLTYSGSRTLGYQYYKFEGDADAFSSLTNYGTGLQRFTDIGNLSLQGSKVFGLLDFRATFTDNRFSDPEQQQYTLNYKRNSWDVSYGTVQASLLNGNRFVNFSRSLNGLVGDYKKGRMETKFISSEARGAARTVTLEGNNTSGPYYLQSGRVIGGSIRILLDGVELVQGVDYLVDVSIGSINFVNRVIPPTSTIVASYESYDITGTGGSIRGAGIAYDLGAGAGRISVNTVQQIVGDASTSILRTDKFAGFGFPGDEYPLQYEPNLNLPIQVKVDGILRSFSPFDDGVSEFYINPNRSSVVISRTGIPKTQNVDIIYTPKEVQAVDGNRKVLGIDWRIPLGSKNNTGSYISFSKANGKLEGPSGSSGNADAVDLRLNEGKGTLKMGFRKIEPGFRTIEQTGFSRNEDATEYSYDYATKGFTSTIGTANSLVTVDNGSTLSSSRLLTTSASFRYSDPNKKVGEPNRFQSLTWNKSQILSTDNNSLNALSFKDDFRNKKFSFGYGIDNITGHGRVDGVLTGIGVNSYKTSATYDAGKSFMLMASASKSFVRTDTIRSEGYDYTIRANMAQTGPWAGGVDYTVSDSGILASLGGFLNGNSFGYGNNGFGSSGGTGVISTGQLKAKRASINATHQAGENLTLTATYATTSTQGSSTSNSKIDTLAVNASWKINNTHTFVLDLVKVKSDFLNSTTGVSNSDVLAGFLIGSPGKFWSYSFGYNLMKSTGSQLGQDNFGISADINYRFRERHRLFMNTAVSQTRGLYPQDDISFQAGYAYTIANGIALVGKYNFRNLRNLDPTAIGGAFRANGVSLELTFDLSNRH